MLTVGLSFQYSTKISLWTSKSITTEAIPDNFARLLTGWFGILECISTLAMTGIGLCYPSVKDFIQIYFAEKNHLVWIKVAKLDHTLHHVLSRAMFPSMRENYNQNFVAWISMPPPLVSRILLSFTLLISLIFFFKNDKIAFPIQQCTYQNMKIHK